MNNPEGLRSLWEVAHYAARAAALRAGRCYATQLAKELFSAQSMHTVYVVPDGKDVLPDGAVVPLDANYGVSLREGLCVLDFDTEAWHPTLLDLAAEFKELRNAPRVLTPNGAHVYFRVRDLEPGRWKHPTLPVSLLANGHAVGPGSVINGRMYIPDPEQKKGFPSSYWDFPKLDLAPGGPHIWPGCRYMSSASS